MFCIIDLVFGCFSSGVKVEKVFSYQALLGGSWVVII